MSRTTLPRSLALIFALLFAGAPALFGEETQNASTGVIAGQVTYEGDVPKFRIADNAGHRRDLIEVDRKTHGLQYVLVYVVVDGEGSGTARGEAAPPEPAVVDQKDHAFVPHLLAVRSGQTVRFTNSDPANHNVRALSFNEKNDFNVITGIGKAYEQRFFVDPKNRPIILSCDIHPWMRGWIYVLDHPYYAVTDARGRFQIEGVPPGTYRLTMFQPDGGYQHAEQVDVRAGKSTRIERRVTRDDLKGL